MAAGTQFRASNIRGVGVLGESGGVAKGFYMLGVRGFTLTQRGVVWRRPGGAGVTSHARRLERAFFLPPFRLGGGFSRGEERGAVGGHALVCLTLATPSLAASCTSPWGVDFCVASRSWPTSGLPLFTPTTREPQGAPSWRLPGCSGRCGVGGNVK